MMKSYESPTIDFIESFYKLAVIKPYDIPKVVSHNRVITHMMNKVLPLIQSSNINVYVIPLPPGKLNRYWSDYSHSYILKFYDNVDYLDKEYIIITIYLDNELNINKDQDIDIEHSLSRKNEMLVYDLFILHLPYHFSWTGKAKDNMTISYEGEQY